MSGKDWLTVAAVAIEFASALYYLWNIFKGDTRPNPISWGGWTAIGAVGAWAARSGGAGLSFYVSASFVVVTAAIFVASLIPGYGHSGTAEREPTDLPVLIAGIVLLVLRALSIGPASLHVTLAILGDFCFTWFTLRKAYRYPETEALLAWIGAVISAGIGLIVLGSHNYTAAIFSLYLLVANASIAGAVIAGQRKAKAHNKPRRR